MDLREITDAATLESRIGDVHAALLREAEALPPGADLGWTLQRGQTLLTLLQRCRWLTENEWITHAVTASQDWPGRDALPGGQRQAVERLRAMTGTLQRAAHVRQSPRAALRPEAPG